MTGTFLVAPGRGVDPRWYTWLADAAAEAGFTPVIADGRLRGVALLVVAAADDRVCPPYQAALLAGSARAHGLAVHASTIPAAGHFFERVPCLESATAEVAAVVTAWLARAGPDAPRAAGR